MTTIAKYSLKIIFRQIAADLSVFPGRFSIAWRVGALCSLMALVAMVYQIPESAISCYLILFVMKPDQLESILMALAVSVLASVVIVLMFLTLSYTLAYPPIRMIVLIGSSIVFLWLGSASKLGPVGSIIALIIAFIMSVLGDVPNGELATRAILYAWLMAVSPMFLLVGFSLLIGRSSWKLLCNNLSERLIVAADTLAQPDVENKDKLQQLLRYGQQEHLKRIMLIKFFYLRHPEQMKWMEDAVNSSYRLLLATAALSASLPLATRIVLTESCRRAAEAMKKGESDRLDVPKGESEVHAALRSLSHPDNLNIDNTTKSNFLADDAFSNPVHIQFALKTTLASFICYLIYTILDWQDIHTAMVTCYVAVLGTTGETVHKLVLRITGCLIGAAIGIFSLIYIVPMMNDIGQLMILVFFTLTLAAWVSSGNERISYSGIQIGLAFLLTVLHGYSPSGDLAVAFDRIAGILLGNLVIYIIFTLIWPVPIIFSVRSKINEALITLSILAALPTTARSQSTREAGRVEEQATGASELLNLIIFEPNSMRPTKFQYLRFRAIISEIRELYPILFLPEKLPRLYIEKLYSLNLNVNERSSEDILIADMTGQDPLSEHEMIINTKINKLKELLGWNSR